MAEESGTFTPPKPVIRDAPSHDDLANRLRKSQSGDPAVAQRRPDPASDPSKINPPEDIVKSSDIISYNGLTTLVPKRAILALPQNLKDRVGTHNPSHRLVAWKEFVQANRAWINTIEVSRAQAEGNEKLSESDLEGIAKATRLTVATFQGGPISVLPPKAPATDAAGTTPPNP